MSGVKNIISRSLWTFVQTFAGTWVSLNIALNQSTWEQIKTALIASAGAGLFSVAKNLAVEEAASRAVAKQTDLIAPTIHPQNAPATPAQSVAAAYRAGWNPANGPAPYEHGLPVAGLATTDKPPKL